jgi:hypothetical protein
VKLRRIRGVGQRVRMQYVKNVNKILVGKKER